MMLFYHVKRKLLYLFLLNSILSLSQTTLKGEITNSGDNEGIHVFNKTFHKYTITNQDGKFEISARVNDTIVFSAVQYQLKEVIISEHTLHEPLFILLTTEVNELDEVFIGYELTRDLNTDSQHIKTIKPIEFGLTESFKGLGEFEGVLEKDNQTEIGENEVPAGLNIFGLIGLLLPKSNKVVVQEVIPLKYSKDDLILYFGSAFLSKDLNLKPVDYERFIQFTEFDETLIKALKTRNNFDLVHRLLVLRKEFTPSE